MLHPTPPHPTPPHPTPPHPTCTYVAPHPTCTRCTQTYIRAWAAQHPHDTVWLMILPPPHPVPCSYLPHVCEEQAGVDKEQEAEHDGPL